MPVRANLAVAIAAIRELLEETLRSRRLDANAARALALALEGLGALWDAFSGQQEERDRNGRDCADFFDSAPEACVITDVNGVVRRANAAAAELFGVALPALPRRPLDAFLLSSPTDPMAVRLLESISQGGNPPAIRWQTLILRGCELAPVEVSVREMGRMRGRVTGLCWLLRPAPSVKPGEKQEQPAEQPRVAQQVDARNVALERVALLPEAMEDGRRRDGEHDQAHHAERRVPVEVDEGAARELQRDAEPEGGARERQAGRGHALDVVGDARLGEVAGAGHDKVGEDEVHARKLEPALHQTPR